ncbi:MAG: nickel pincer cofactor biosynthesis protein LarB [Telmatospirillum sp.]|nr:nickel pincer cofactor biosynthesis protein LarB [Telmatospirillum sp.]
MTDIRMDWAREKRTGLAEAVFCAGKTARQIDAILAEADGRRLLLTRLGPEKCDALDPAHRNALDYDPLSGTAFLGTPAPLTARGAAVVCAGTSDLPVAREATRTLAFYGWQAPLIADVGVTGLWRLMERLDEIRAQDVVIAVAGMEGALFSVLAGLVESVVIAVPSSIGYGVAANGQAALSSALSSCAPGVLTVNIDNGFGAAGAAIKILKLRSR